MSSDGRALQRISQLAKQEATGELICASDAVEVHVYLQRGRVAWATDAGHPLAFTRYLLQSAQIDVDVFREILESCRREKRPLGETLIAWGVATREEVREALRHQIELALGLLAAPASVDSLFLNRAAQFADYDGELTFAVEELLLRDAIAPPPPLPADYSVRPARFSRPPPGQLSPIDRLRLAIDGVLWAEILEGTGTAESFPEPRPSSRVPGDLLRQTLLDGASFVAVRSSTTTLVGAPLSTNSTIWCLVEDSAATVGEITSTLRSLSGRGSQDDIEPTPSGRRPPPPANGRLWSLGAGGPSVEAALREFADRAPEVEGVFVTDPATPRSAFGVGRIGISGEELVRLIERRALGLDVHWSEHGTTPPADADSEGLTPYRAMTAEGRFCLFAAEIVVDAQRRLVWLALDGRSSKGLGWGYLTSLSRALVRVMRAEVEAS